MAEILTIAQQLSGVSLATLLLVILFSSFRGIWVWGRQLVEMKTEYELRLAKAEKSAETWQAMALRATGLAETSVGIKP